MEIEVQIAKKCHCVMKHKLNSDLICDNKEEALIKANQLLETISEKSCKTHLFFIKEEENRVIIDSKYNPDKMF